MEKQQKHFNKLWKVKVLKEIATFEDDFMDGGGKVTRISKFDNERTLKLIEYGFEEGIRFMKNQRNEKIDF